MGTLAVGRLVAWFAFVAAFAALAYGERFSGATEDSSKIAYEYSSSIAAVIGYALTLGIMLWIARGTRLRAAFALRRPRSWRQVVRISALVLLAVIVVNAAVAQFGNADKEQGLTPSSWNSHRVAQFAAFAFVVAVVGPLVEELTFRGVGFSLLERYGQTVAIVVVGLAFGLIHGLLLGFPIVAVFGIGLAYLRSRTGSIYPCVVLHAFFNGVALALSVAT